MLKKRMFLLFQVEVLHGTLLVPSNLLTTVSTLLLSVTYYIVKHILFPVFSFHHFTLFNFITRIPPFCFNSFCFFFILEVLVLIMCNVIYFSLIRKIILFPDLPSHSIRSDFDSQTLRNFSFTVNFAELNQLQLFILLLCFHFLTFR